MFKRKQPQPHPAPSFDAGSLSFEELINLKGQIDAEIAGKQGDEVQSLKTRIAATAAALGVSVAELLGLRSEPEPVKRKRKASAEPKYRNPAAPTQTWSGRGKVPRWLQERLDQGAVKEQFLSQ